MSLTTTPYVRYITDRRGYFGIPEMARPKVALPPPTKLLWREMTLWICQEALLESFPNTVQSLRAIGVHVGRGCQNDEDSDNSTSRTSARGDHQQSPSEDSHGQNSRARLVIKPSSDTTLKAFDRPNWDRVLTEEYLTASDGLAPYRNCMT